MMKGRSDIHAELQSISKLVADLPYGPVFTVPDGYFVHFPESMLLKIRELEIDADAELNALSPLLAGISKKMPMSVPDGYFSEVKIPAQEEPAIAPVIPLKRSPYRSLAIAASFVFLLGFAAFLFNRMSQEPMQTTPVNVNAELPKVSDSEMNEFLNAFPDLGPTEPITVASGPVDVEYMIEDIDEEGLKSFLQDLPELKTQTFN